MMVVPTHIDDNSAELIAEEPDEYPKIGRRDRQKSIIENAYGKKKSGPPLDCLVGISETKRILSFASRLCQVAEQKGLDYEAGQQPCVPR